MATKTIVRIARPAARPYQLRYTCPQTGKPIRISVGSRNEQEAERMRDELQAKLTLGIPARKERQAIKGPNMEWEIFREAYRSQQLVTLKDRSAADTESRLDIAERIMKPRTLGDVASAEALTELQTKLLAGVASRRGKPRSPHSVRSYLASILAALNWAEMQGWIDRTPRIRRVKTSKLKGMKGRPITAEEFERMLAAVPKALMPDEIDNEGKPINRLAEEIEADATDRQREVFESWRHVLRGLWASALRLDELMHVSWDVPNTITPQFRRGRLPILHIPATMQKNATEEEIPLLPWLEDLLTETPAELRSGWVFEPQSLQVMVGRAARQRRPDTEWVGKIISRIGEAAGVIVSPADERTGRPVKYASAHDLRRSCGQRMEEAGVPRHIVTRVMRHASEATTKRYYIAGNVQMEAGKLRELLTVPKRSGYTQEVESS